MARRRKRDPEDPQQFPLYAWQAEVGKRWPDSVRLTVRECKALIEGVYARYGLKGKQPSITGTRDKHWANYSRLGHCVGLPPLWARNRYVVLHETAHSLLPETVESHGPEFASLVVQLWSESIPSFDAAGARQLAAEMPEPVGFAFGPAAGGPRASGRASRLAREILPSALLFLYVTHAPRVPWSESAISAFRRPGSRGPRTRRHPFIEAQVELL